LRSGRARGGEFGRQFGRSCGRCRLAEHGARCREVVAQCLDEACLLN
jgi:hypothetical protein